MIDHSFAVLAYKDSPYLSECLDSLKNQTVHSHIYITTSTPSTYINDIGKKYNLEVFVSPTWNGMAGDWNFGFEKASTKYVTLVHQDDLYLPRYAESCFNAAEKYTDTLICFTDYSELVGGKERSGTLLLNVKLVMLNSLMLFQKSIHSRRLKKLLLSFGCPIAAPTVMFNRRLLDGFQFSSEFSINIDWDAWSRIAEMKGRFVYVNEKLLQHRIHPESATSSGLEANLRQSEDVRMFRRYWPGVVAKILMRFYSKSYKSNHPYP